MESINQIDLRPITNKDSDIYVIDATTLGGKSVSNFALLNGNNMFTGSENYFQGTLAAEEVEVSGEINAKDFGAVWTLPGTAYIGEGIRFSTFDKGGTISATVKGDPYDTTGVLQIEAPYAGIHLSDSEITLEVDRPAILNLKDGRAVMCAEAIVDIYSIRDNALLEITPNEISIHNKACFPADPIRLSYVGGEDCDELHVYCKAYFQGDIYSITSGTITISSVGNDQEITSNISMQPDLISISADGVEGEVDISAGPGPSHIRMYDDELTLHMQCDTGYSISNFNAYSIRLSAFDNIDLYTSSQGSSISMTAEGSSVSVTSEGSVDVTARAGLWINEKKAWHQGNLTFEVTDNGTTLEITTK